MDNAELKSDGERLAAAYWNQRELQWDYEPEIGGRHPDFLVHHSRREFVAEVYEPELRLPDGGGWFSSYPAIRSNFEGRKRRQIAAVKGAGLPYVAVLAGTNSDLRFDPLVTAGAMFGDLASQVRLGVPTSSATVTVFGGGGRLQAQQFRGVSAVALVEWFNPTQSRLDAVLEERFAQVPEWHASMTQGEINDATALILRIDIDTRAEFIASGEYDPDALRTRMTVLHNPHAEFPLGFDILNAPDDRQWATIETSAGPAYGERERSTGLTA